ncbi:MAG: hypothetical protein GC164_07025 [Phycisphaera sp.]|nr:hypothetical protein [Phycisphaera sp.]
MAIDSFITLALSVPEWMTPDATTPAWLAILLIALATFVSEDLTCVATGLLIQRGVVHPAVGLAGCFVGIFVGDMGLWLIGRTCWGALERWRWFARRLPHEKLERFGAWFDKHAGKTIFASRFMPGTRMPLYLAAGALGHKGGRFIFWVFVAGGVWTPVVVLLSAALGEAFIEPFERFLGSGWLALVAVVLVIFLIVRFVALMMTPTGRNRVYLMFARIGQREFWPAWVFYLPLWPWLIYLGLRYGGLRTCTCANPAIEHSGFVGESKNQILGQLDAAFVAPFKLIPSGNIDVRMETFRGWMRDAVVDYPLILKPDAGQRGASVRLVQDDQQAREYFSAHPVPTIAQRYHPGPCEAGLFFILPPDAQEGFIFSITHKEFPVLVGDGVHTLERLILRHPRYRMQAGVFMERHAQRLEQVLARGEAFTLVRSGNHCQGTIFKDGSFLITPELTTAINHATKNFRGFHVGRFDLRYTDQDSLKAGGGFEIIELNGLTSESTNIYDPSRGTLWAYRTLFAQWHWVFRIGYANRKRGAHVSTWRGLWHAYRRYYREQLVTTAAD